MTRQMERALPAAGASWAYDKAVATGDVAAELHVRTTRVTLVEQDVGEFAIGLQVVDEHDGVRGNGADSFGERDADDHLVGCYPL